ncbi:ubiquinol oxidase subunit II [Cohnella lubricantis]|uniref:Quinol oxidase subunit 2 n=1 Tax=Cohnella lubricantis TaxID=2163172 RepID=A0A841T953_9BACL|nr:ubiquinol oxidase subunit II [Cohnella lubricantis]MBB6678043.1 ubiquinol oxidase subunit II [Cohnella lubricantis]MBP2120019.1 cytochrome o ubiquinol oxidase subunit 2 [Cohnella lubricantis]
MTFVSVIRRIAACLALSGLALGSSGCQSMIVFDPKGPVGAQERDLIYFTIGLCLIVIVPVLLLTVWILWRYREKRSGSVPYQPEWSHNTKLEVIWWGVPIVIILILAIVTGRYTHALDPAKPLKSDVKPVTIQVTSLNWKWLFQYPEQGIATVNYVVIPEKTPIRFELTSDGPMNGFWVPQLGGMIYTMSGMATTLYLQADEPGSYLGTGGNFTGREFAKMAFPAEAVKKADFDQWVSEAKSSGNVLTEDNYQLLAQPGVADKLTFASIPQGLFHKIVHEYSMSRGAPAGIDQKAITLSGELAKEHTEGGQLAPDSEPSVHAGQAGRSGRHGHLIDGSGTTQDQRK